MIFLKNKAKTQVDFLGKILFWLKMAQKDPKITPLNSLNLEKSGPYNAGPFYAGPNNAKRPKLTPLRAGVIRANKVYN